MRKNWRHLPFLCLGLFLWALCLTSVLHTAIASNSAPEKEGAEKKVAGKEETSKEATRRFHLASDERIVDAYGILIFDPIVKTPGPADSTNEDVQSLIKPESVTKTALVKELDQGIWEISTALTAEEQDRSGKVTVIAITDSGKILPGGVQLLKESIEYVRLQKEQLQCNQRENGVTAKLLRLNEKSLTSLVEVRSAKEEVLRNHLAQLLSPGTVEKLSQREKALGLYYPEPISEKLPLTELASRITAINALSKNIPSSAGPSLESSSQAPSGPKASKSAPASKN